jgi:hypothetical protein
MRTLRSTGAPAVIVSLALSSVLVAGPAVVAQEVTPELTADVQEVIAQVQDERGMQATQEIVWRLATTEDALNRQLEEITGDPEIVDRLGQDERILTRIGLLPPGTDLLQLLLDTLGEQVAGFYDPEARELTVIDGDGQLDALSRVTLAHEIQHALQDQRWDLDGMMDAIDPVEGDRALALQSLIEGDATLLMTLWAVKHGSADLMAETDGPGIPGGDQLDNAPQVIQRQLLGPYLDGLTFLMDAWGPGGWEAVDEVWENPPVSTEQVMHPELYPDHLPIPVALPDLAAGLGDEWRLTGETVMGELNTGVFVADGAEWDRMTLTLGGPSMPNADAAAGWGGDRLVTLDGPDGAWALVWQLAWDTPDDMSEFIPAAISAMQDLPGAWELLETDLTGSDLPSPVLILVADSPETLELLTTAAMVPAG